MVLAACHMTFRRAIGLSLAVHAVLFGGALAFAYYGGMLSPGGVRSISVSLVGSGDGAGKNGGSSQVQPRKAAMRSPEVPAEEDSGMPEHTAANGNENGNDDAVLAVHTGIGSGQDGIEQGGGTPAGYTSDEWARFSAALERVKSYPRLARERGIEGTVLLRFKVRPSGGVETVDIVKSSGAAILDDAAVQTVRSASPVPYVNGWVEVPLVYELK